MKLQAALSGLWKRALALGSRSQAGRQLKEQAAEPLSREPGAGSREPGAGSREPGAGSREPGAHKRGSRQALASAYKALGSAR